MPKFVIEREIVGAGKLPKQELQAISQKSSRRLAPRCDSTPKYVSGMTSSKPHQNHGATDSRVSKIVGTAWSQCWSCR